MNYGDLMKSDIDPEEIKILSSQVKKEFATVYLHIISIVQAAV